ncbi:skin secretory protein xP2-like [Amphibalanus amphitrite]|uniref:skin secretory protein xP2-like n=1 Tax=Amphibalanus amphitrite TaxID=1232801 RepID=UPI001C90DDF9|nr:skin secretory protein xP2-like [Amphibalanus amphitrite]
MHRGTSPMATDLLATVLSDIKFSTANGSEVCMRKDEQVLILEKTNSRWWKVVRSGQGQPFYAPSDVLQERAVPRVRLRSGTGSVRDRRRAPLSAVDAERHISGHEDAVGAGWDWRGAAAAGSPVARSSSMDDVLAESPSRAGHTWHRRQSWAPERRSEGRQAAGGALPAPAALPEPSHRRSHSYQLEMSRAHGSDQSIGSTGRPRPAAGSDTWERKGPPPAPPGASSTWERGATGGSRAPHGTSNTWERGGRVDPQFAQPEPSWERKGTSGPIVPQSGAGVWEPALDGSAPPPYGGSSTWERGKDSVRVRGPMAMSWQTERKQAPVPPPRTRHALQGMAAGVSGPSGAAEPAGLSTGRGIINQSAPSLAFDAIDARRPSPSSLAARRPSPSSLSDLRAQRPDLSDGHNEGYRRTAERLAGRSESPRPPPAAADRTEGIWMPARLAERPPVRTEETAAGTGTGRPAVPPRPSRRPAAEQQQQPVHALVSPRT